MPTFEKRAGRIRVQGAINGRRISATFDTKAQATQWWLEQRAETRPSNRTKTVADALRQYLEKVVPTKRGAVFETRRISSWLGRPTKRKRRGEGGKLPILGMLIDDVTPEDIGAIRDARLKQVSAGTVLRELTVLSSVFERARKEWRWCRSNPVHDIDKPSAPEHRDRLMTEDERDRILMKLGWDNGPPEILKHEVALAMLLALETAMRAGEVLKAKPDLKARVARLAMTKNGKRREVPLSTRAVELYELIPGGFTVSSASRDALFRKARDEAGVEGLTFHDTRHTAITRLAEKIEIWDLCRMTGHKNPKALLPYYNKSASEIAKKLD